MNPLYVLAAAAAIGLIAQPASAATIVDPTGDLLGTYTGPSAGYLDITGAGATFDGVQFDLSATLAGTLGAPGSLYVFGINRGAGTPRLTFATPSVGAGVLFDAVAVLFPDGTGRLVTFSSGPPTITNLSGAVTVSGNSISGLFPAALLPSTGFAPSDYTFTLWSRQRADPAVDGTTVEIADFAPNASGFLATAVPEPSTWMMMLLGFGLAGSMLRRSKSRRTCSA